MKQEKFNIKIERDIFAYNEKGNAIKIAYPKNFGKSEKNNFIKLEGNGLKVITPFETNINILYNKLLEITNIVTLELYNKKQYVIPDLGNARITLEIDKEYYDELKDINSNIPKNLKSGLTKISKNFENVSKLFNEMFGNLKIDIINNQIIVSNITLNEKINAGLSENDINIIVTLIFASLLDFEANTLKSEIKELLKINKSFGLKAHNALSSLEERKVSENEFENAKKLLLNTCKTRYIINKYPKLVAESVCIIKDAISQGIDYEVLNEAKSLVRFDLNGHKEFVIEGNKTDRDTYIFPIITDDKFTSKQIMADAGINVPKAILLDSEIDEEDIDALVSPFYNNRIVVKPRNTNYGTGITVFAKPASKKQILDAIKYAFKFDTNILIEEYQKGMEFRFLVVDGKCLSIVNRRPASVVGDGKSTIKELIEEKNKEDWHALTGTLVKSDEPVVEYLKLQNLDFNSIIPKGKRVFLRTNSNCSTGGESVVYTDVMPSRFKKVAEKAANAFNGKICGVDIIIDDFNKDDYAIIEINDNPGYSINEWPYEGKEARIGLAIFDMLGMKQ